MPDATFHTLRLRLLELGKEISAFVDEVDPAQSSLSCRLIYHDAPSLVVVVGTSQGVREQATARIAAVDPETYAKTGLDSHYRYLHHHEHPPLRSAYPETTVFVQEQSKYLEKLSFLELRSEAEEAPLVDQEVSSLAEGMLFVISAVDPWEATSWRHFEQLQGSFSQCTMVCVSELGKLHKKDGPVLQKHLSEKLEQVTGRPTTLQQLDCEDLFSLQTVRAHLENHAIGQSKWEGLRDLSTNCEAAFTLVEDQLRKEQAQLHGATQTASELKKELLALREQIWRVLYDRIHTIGYSLDEQAGSILKKVSGSLTMGAYFRSLAGKSTSLRSLQDGLENILCETLLGEVHAVCKESNALITAHAKSFKIDHPEVLKFCPVLGEWDEFSPPTPLAEEEVKREVQKVLRELRLKSLVRDQLRSIDQSTTRKVRLSLLALTGGALLGIMGWNLAGLLTAGSALLLFLYGLWERRSALKNFFAFLRDWVLEVGTRVEEPVAGLIKGMIDHSLDLYSGNYLDLLAHIEDQEKGLPEWQEQLRGLFFNYREIARELKL